jgi:hypothetical protein
MTNNGATTTEAPPTTATTNGQPHEPQATGSPSIAQQFRQRQQARINSKRLFLPFPETAGEMVVRYRVLDPQQVQRYVDIAQAGEASLTDNADLIVDACDGIFIKDPATGELVEQADEFGGVDFGRLAPLLGSSAKSTRELIAELVAGNVFAVGHHAAKVLEWMEDTTKKVEGSLQGESLASR